MASRLGEDFCQNKSTSFLNLESPLFEVWGFWSWGSDGQYFIIGPDSVIFKRLPSPCCRALPRPLGAFTVHHSLAILRPKYKFANAMIDGPLVSMGLMLCKHYSSLWSTHRIMSRRSSSVGSNPCVRITCKLFFNILIFFDFIIFRSDRISSFYIVS